MRLLWIILFVGASSGTVHAENLWDKVKKGARNTGQAIENGAEAVGGAVASGANTVSGAIDSTVELFSNESTPEETRVRLDAMAQAILTRLLAENTDAATLFRGSAGYAAFDSRQITVFPFSASYGRGVAVSPDNEERTYMNVGTGGAGAALGIGGFETQFVILFETPADFIKFVTQGYDATAGAGAMKGTDINQESAHFVQGRSFFALSKKGWRVNANATGTKYWRSPELN